MSWNIDPRYKVQYLPKSIVISEKTEVIGFKPVYQLKDAVHPVIRINNKSEYTVTGIYGYNKENIAKAVKGLESYIYRKYDDQENNYGLTFYACGYNGKAQQAFQENCSKEWDGVYVT